jgi:hypothetical protein
MICINRHWPDGQGGTLSSYGEHNDVMPYWLSFILVTSTIPNMIMFYLSAIGNAL